jgi:hypothetical protein
MEGRLNAVDRAEDGLRRTYARLEAALLGADASPVA